MAAFPTLKPSTRTFTPGDYPHSPFRAWNGRQNRVRISNVMLNSQLRLTFLALTKAEMLSILTHYRGQVGGFSSFLLPTDVLSGVTSPSDFTLSGYGWVYAEPPNVEDLPCGGHNVELSLVSVPPEGTALIGLNALVLVLLTAGTASAGNGAQLGVAVSLTPGSAGLPALDQTVTVTLAAGTASSGVNVAGLSRVVYVSVANGVSQAAFGLQETVTVSLVAGTGSAAATDPSFSSVSVLLHMDGSNNSTTFTDSGPNVLTVTPSGNAKISTAQSKFGGASAYFDGSADYLDISGSSLLSFPGAFSIQGWVRPDFVNTSYRTVCEIGTYANGVLFRTSVSTSTNDSVYVNGVNLGNISSSFAAGTWAYFSITRNASNLVEVAIDDTVVKSATVTGTINSSNGGLRIGRALHTSGQDLSGYVDDFRITKGVARPHTVPTEGFPDS